MKNINIVVFSDNHGVIDFDLPKDIDLLLIAGDITPFTGSQHSAYQRLWFDNNFLPFIENKAKNIVFVAGNHDRMFEKIMKSNEEDSFRATLPKHIHYLRDSMIELDGLKIYGTPFTPMFCNWFFMDDENGLDRRFSKIPENIDILLSHGPAFGLSDMISQRCDIGKNCGSTTLLKHVQRVNPTYFFSGHIHSANHILSDFVYNNKVTKYANVSILDEYYEPLYIPLTVPLNPLTTINPCDIL